MTRSKFKIFYNPTTMQILRIVVPGMPGEPSTPEEDDRDLSFHTAQEGEAEVTVSHDGDHSLARCAREIIAYMGNRLP